MGGEKRRGHRRADPGTAVDIDLELALSVEVVWDYMADVEFRRIVGDSDRHEVLDRRQGRVAVGSAYQCYHGDRIIQQVVLEWRPFERIVIRDRIGEAGDGFYVLSVWELAPTAAGINIKIQGGPVRGTSAAPGRRADDAQGEAAPVRPVRPGIPGSGGGRLRPQGGRAGVVSHLVTVSEPTLTVSELMARISEAVSMSLPGPVWVRGEITGMRRTSGGSAFFRLADSQVDGAAVDVVGRGLVMARVDRDLDDAGLGSLRDGVEVKLMGTVGVDPRRSAVRLSLLRVDPAFTAGRLALGKAEVLRRMSADRSLAANSLLEIPLVPLRVGLVTSRGIAAHADFIDHLRRSGFRFSVKTAHTVVQGETAPQAVAASLARVVSEPVDMVALIRGGGSKLDLAVFDTEVVGRAVAAMPVPVVTGIGHEIDRTVADEAAAVAEKTPTAASEWLVTQVKAYADRVDVARQVIRSEARTALGRANVELKGAAAVTGSVRDALALQRELLSHRGALIADTARSVVAAEAEQLRSLTEWFSTVGVGPTLSRGFALVTTADGKRVIRTVGQLAPGDRLLVRLSDGTVPVTVDETWPTPN